MNSELEADTIQNSMRSIRNRRHKRIGELKIEAQRLVDWREYVKTAPVVSVLSSVVAGFMVINAFKRTHSPKLQGPEAPSATPLKVAEGPKLNWLIAMAMPIVTQAAKKYVMQGLKNAIQQSSQEFKSKQSTFSEQRVSDN